MDGVRHLLPDVVVFLTALVTLCISAWLVTLHKRKEGQEEGEEGGKDEGGRGGRSESVPDGAEQQQMENGGEIEGDTGQGGWEVGVVNRLILCPQIELHPAAHQCRW